MILDYREAGKVLDVIRVCDMVNATVCIEMEDGSEVLYDGTQVSVYRARRDKELYSCAADFAEAYGHSHEGGW